MKLKSYKPIIYYSDVLQMLSKDRNIVTISPSPYNDAIELNPQTYIRWNTLVERLGSPEQAKALWSYIITENNIEYIFDIISYLSLAIVLTYEGPNAIAYNNMNQSLRDFGNLEVIKRMEQELPKRGGLSQAQFFEAHPLWIAHHQRNKTIKSSTKDVSEIVRHIIAAEFERSAVAAQVIIEYFHYALNVKDVRASILYNNALCSLIDKYVNIVEMRMDLEGKL